MAFKWSRKSPGGIGMSVPGRNYRVGAFALVVAYCVYQLAAGGVAQGTMITIVMCSPAFLLIAPEMVEFWSWYARKAEEHAVDREERIYRFGYTDIRMLMVGEKPWFAAADVGSALGFADVDQETRLFDVTRCDIVNGEIYLSEAGVRTLIEHSRHRDTRSFKVWFDREVMFPLNRAREQERKARGEQQP